MQNSLLTKGLVLGILMLFVGTTISQNAITKNPSDAASKFNQNPSEKSMTFKSGMNRLDNLSLKRRQAFSSPRGESHAILLRGRGDSLS